MTKGDSMTTPSVVAISRQFGSGGAYVGREVASRLGFHYADREILDEAAHALNLPTSDVAPLEERVRGFWERWGALFATGAVDIPSLPPPLPVVTPLELFELERQVITSLADRGRTVIVGRGAAHVLQGRRDVLRVFLHAPSKVRADLALREYGLGSRDDALRMVRETDGHRARFIRAISGHDWYDATLYDATLDTSVVGMDGAADFIVALCRGASAAPAPSAATDHEGGGRA
jgi:CMP/dCMP kinase